MRLRLSLRRQRLHEHRRTNRCSWPCAEIEIHAELDRVVLAPEGVVKGWRRRGRVEVGVIPPRMLVLREQRDRVPRELPRRRLILAAKTEREARRGDVALRSGGKIDVEVVVEERRTGESIEIEARRGDDTRLPARIDEPVRGV